MLLLRSFAPTPWKNGGGSTLQLAIHPPGATLDDFEWRVSVATIERDGPFSSYPGHRRTLALLDGPGFELDLDGRKVRVERPLEPVRFDGGARVGCRLLGGPARDFGIISRRDADLEFIRFDGARTLEATLLVVLEGRIEIGGEVLDALAVAYPDPGSVEVRGRGIVAAVKIGARAGP